MIEQLHKYHNNIIKDRTSINERDTHAHILRVLITRNMGLRCTDIAKECKMGRERISQNLSKMIDKGILLKEEVNNTKYYFPQPIFWDNDIINGMYERMLPFVKEIKDDLIYDQIKDDECERTSVLECIQILLKLFSFEIEKLEDKITS